MYSLLFKKFLFARATVIGLVIIMLAGIMSIVMGKRFLQKQEAAIQQSAQFQKEYTETYVKYVSSDIGLLLYYLRFSLANKPDPLAGFSIGQRDVNPAVQSVTIRNLENQKWDTDLINPSNLLLGNMDAGFVMIYLFPLLIISFTYSLYSEEKEGGTWKLLQLHAPSPKKILWQKLMVRMTVVYGAAALLLLLAVFGLSLPLNKALLAVILVLALYLAFWAALSFWVVSWKKNSSFNAVCLLALWVFLTILSPAVINTWISSAYPVPEALQTAVQQRQAYHEKWDMDKQSTMDKFYAHYPQYTKYRLPGEQFSWLWYYAMHQMGDDESAKESKALEEKLWTRHRVSTRVAMFFPALHTQLSLNSLANSDLGNHLLFLDSTKRFHEKIRLGFYDKIFENKPVSSVDWRSFDIEFFSVRPYINWFTLLLPLLILTMILFALAGRHFRTINQDET